MPLPKVEHSKYNFTIPSTGEVVKFRPYTVREEKVLFTALESDNPDMMISTLKDLIAATTFGTVDPTKLTSYDLDLFFLNLRAKSSGEELTLDLINKTCPLKDNKSECDKPTKLKLNLEEIKVQIEKDGKFIPYEGETQQKQNTIALTTEMGVVMRHPAFDDMGVVKKLSEEDSESLSEAVFELMANCLLSVYDKENVYNASQFTQEERLEFFYNLERPSINNILEFFDHLPEVRYECKFKCDHCDTVRDYTIQGTDDFFV